VTEPAVPEAWITLADTHRMRTQMDASPRRHPYDFGFVAGMSRLIAAHDRIGPAFSALFRQVMFEPGCLDRREREMIAAVAAAAQDCRY
jgi:alkylhydroperoxidase/carboxymuconolactone decarboxylase family protein YurZ